MKDGKEYSMEIKNINEICMFISHCIDSKCQTTTRDKENNSIMKMMKPSRFGNSSKHNNLSVLVRNWFRDLKTNICANPFYHYVEFTYNLYTPIPCLQTCVKPTNYSYINRFMLLRNDRNSTLIFSIDKICFLVIFSFWFYSIQM